MMKKFGWVILLFMFLLAGCNKVEEKETNVDENRDFQIISIEEKTQIITYVIEQKGFRDNIRLEIDVMDNQIVNIAVLSHRETITYFNRIEDANFIENLIQANVIENVDVVSSATKTSQAIKDAVLNTLEFHLKRSE